MALAEQSVDELCGKFVCFSTNSHSFRIFMGSVLLPAFLNTWMTHIICLYDGTSFVGMCGLSNRVSEIFFGFVIFKKFVVYTMYVYILFTTLKLRK